MSHKCCCVVGSGKPLTEKQSETIAEAFAVLADPARLRLLSVIASCQDCCACDLTTAVGKSQPTVSHHMKVLTEAGFVRATKQGRWVFYEVDQTKLEALCDCLVDTQSK